MLVNTSVDDNWYVPGRFGSISATQNKELVISREELYFCLTQAHADQICQPTA